MKFTINICPDCYRLKGEMCHNPDCVFIRCTMADVSKYLDMLLIRPIINGKQLGGSGDPRQGFDSPDPLQEADETLPKA